jgi:hypothetical protein
MRQKARVMVTTSVLPSIAGSEERGRHDLMIFTVMERDLEEGL